MEWDFGRQLCPAVTATTSSAKLTGPLQPIFFQRGKRNVRMVEGIPSNSAAIIDGMSLLKKVNTDR